MRLVAGVGGTMAALHWTVQQVAAAYKTINWLHRHYL